jgi:hypothetical protein
MTVCTLLLKLKTISNILIKSITIIIKVKKRNEILPVQESSIVEAIVVALFVTHFLGHF